MFGIQIVESREGLMWENQRQCHRLFGAIHCCWHGGFDRTNSDAMQFEHLRLEIHLRGLLVLAEGGIDSAQHLFGGAVSHRGIRALLGTDRPFGFHVC